MTANLSWRYLKRVTVRATQPQKMAKEPRTLVMINVKSLSSHSVILLTRMLSKKIFGKFGSMTKCNLVMQNGRSRGIAFIEYENASSAKKAIDSENGATHMGREITVDFSGNMPSEPDGQRQESRDNADSNTVFFGNISFNTTEDIVRDFFSKVGNITSVRIAMSEDGRPRGFCHVEFESPSVAKNALSLNGQ
jgi:nucleolin